jgi:hypothetical protein
MKTTHFFLIMLVGLLPALPSCSSTSAPSQAGSEKIKPYPLSTCIVTDNALGSMGDVITTTYGNQEIKFCCKPCVKKFNADPEKYLKKIR